MSTAEQVRLPDDCTVGYIVEGLLGAHLLHSPLFHSHLENLQRLPPDTLLQQVQAPLWVPLPPGLCPALTPPGAPLPRPDAWLSRQVGFACGWGQTLDRPLGLLDTGSSGTDGVWCLGQRNEGRSTVLGPGRPRASWAVGVVCMVTVSRNRSHHVEQGGNEGQLCSGGFRSLPSVPQALPEVSPYSAHAMFQCCFQAWPPPGPGEKGVGKGALAGLLARGRRGPRPDQATHSAHTVPSQVTLSYGGPENPHNVVNVAGGFSLHQDPTR